MKTKQVLLALFLGLGLLFVLGSTMGVRPLVVVSNYLLVPVLLIYFRLRTRSIFRPVVGVLLLLYIRDIFVIYGITEFLGIIWICFILAMLLLFLCLFTSFGTSRLHPAEVLSFLIMYGFLAFLYFSLIEAIPEEGGFVRFAANSYLVLLMFLSAGSFTSYIMKSHLASLWFMVAVSAFLVSEVSLFFKVLILDDTSVNFFYPFFHVIAYFAFVEYGLNRWRSNKLPYF